MTGNEGRKILCILFLLIVFLLLSSDSMGKDAHVKSPTLKSNVPGHNPEAGEILHYTFQIVNSYPHDSSAFTQGLVFSNGFLYEGTGIRGQSELRKTDLETGKVLQRHTLPDSLFGEGITVINSRLVQLTWRAGAGFVYDVNSFKLLHQFHYRTEGWGITHDGTRLVMSDGSSTLYFLDPRTYEVTARVGVQESGSPVNRLNELEYVNGLVYANIWLTDTIAIIDPETGKVRGKVHLEKLSQIAGGDRAVKTLNGIAYDHKNNRLFVTGKLWHSIYEIKLIPRPLTPDP